MEEGQKNEGVQAPVQAAAPTATPAQPAMGKQRGVTVDTKGVGITLLRPTKEHPIKLGKLLKLEIINRKFKEDGDSSFAGMDVPVLQFTFEEIVLNEGDKKGLAFFDLMPISATLDADFQDTLYNNMFNYIKHFIEVYKGEFTKEDNIFIDIAEGETDGKVIMAGFKKFFDAVIAKFDNGGESIYKDVPVWIKLLLYVGASSVNNGNPGFPRYLPNGGVIEKQVKGRPTNLFVNIDKKESIESRKIEAVSSAGLPPVAGSDVSEIPSVFS